MLASQAECREFEPPHPLQPQKPRYIGVFCFILSGSIELSLLLLMISQEFFRFSTTTVPRLPQFLKLYLLPVCLNSRIGLLASLLQIDLACSVDNFKRDKRDRYLVLVSEILSLEQMLAPAAQLLSDELYESGHRGIAGPTLLPDLDQLRRKANRRIGCPILELRRRLALKPV